MTSIEQFPARPGDTPSLPAFVASIFVRLRLAQRARVLRRLLLPVGPMALAVVGGGVFAKYVGEARWSQLYPSLEDVARVTAAQVYELVRYVEQADPAVLPEVLAVLARDPTAMGALGASLAAIVTSYLAMGGAKRADYSSTGASARRTTASGSPLRATRSAS